MKYLTAQNISLHKAYFHLLVFYLFIYWWEGGIFNYLLFICKVYLFIINYLSVEMDSMKHVKAFVVVCM